MVQQGRRRGVNAPFRKERWRQLAADVHARVDVFASVDAVARRADDLRHVGPHRVEARAAERAAVAGAGNGDEPVSAWYQVDRMISGV